MYCSFCSLDLCLHNQIVRRRHFKLGAGINVKDELKKKKKKKKKKKRKEKEKRKREKLYESS